jgi:predicted HAD superfamily phosphohydrolase YqeG
MKWLRRIPLVRLAGPDGLCELLTYYQGGQFLLDLENTSIPYGTTPRNCPERLGEFLQQSLPRHTTTKVVILSNAPRSLGQYLNQDLVAQAVMKAHKPFTRRTRLSQDEPTALVCGDQVLTDGLLAWRLQVPFVFLAMNTTSCEPIWPRILRRMGEAVKPLFFEVTSLQR